jgi:cyclopropane fatty-acyl-phospholipid synthase-like methyltransferase
MTTRIVKDGYDKMGEEYEEQRDGWDNLPLLELLVRELKKRAKILDIGCGSGVPIDRYLATRGFQVHGIDISEKQIARARRNVPEAQFEIQDMSLLIAREYSVDAIVSFYAIFHVPRDLHVPLFEKLASYLPVGGLLLVTMGAAEWEGEEELHGVRMFWSHFGPERNTRIVRDAGFDVISSEIDASGGERHQVIFARKAIN